MDDYLDVTLASLRDGYVQVSAFVAVTVLLFGLVQYWTGGALVDRIENSGRFQTLFGGLMGLTPGCGGAIVMMPLYVRGKVTFGTVVATLIATAGDAAFVILVRAPGAALASYGIAFVVAVTFGYLVDTVGLGVDRVDSAVERIRLTATDGGMAVASDGAAAGPNPAHDYEGSNPTHAHEHGPDRRSAVLTPLSHGAHVLWWVAAAAALTLGVAYLVRGAPEVAMRVGMGFDGLFTIFGLLGTALSFYLYFVGRHYIGEGSIGRARESFESAYETLQHAAMETSFVTVWVIGAYLLYEYFLLVTGADIAAAAQAAGVLAPIAGAVVGLIPGCGPQIVLAEVYAKGGIPFSALTANAISQDGDALFPLLAIDKKAAIVASIYTTIPALVVGVVLHFVWGPVLGFESFGYGVL